MGLVVRHGNCGLDDVEDFGASGGESTVGVVGINFERRWWDRTNPVQRSTPTANNSPRARELSIRSEVDALLVAKFVESGSPVHSLLFTLPERQLVPPCVRGFDVLPYAYPRSAAMPVGHMHLGSISLLGVDPTHICTTMGSPHSGSGTGQAASCAPRSPLAEAPSTAPPAADLPWARWSRHAPCRLNAVNGRS